MNSLSRRGGLGVAIVLVLFGLIGCMGDTRPHVVIEFGMYPELFEGLDVEIDGRVVGKLKKFGEATRTGFPLDKGEHTVRVLSDRYESLPWKVNAELKLMKVHLLLDLQESTSADGRGKQVLALHP